MKALIFCLTTTLSQATAATKPNFILILTADPGETKNLSANDPQRAAELLAKLHAWQTATQAPRPLQPNPAYDPSAAPKRGRDERGKSSTKSSS
jgi:hypothetical protein